MCTTPDRGLPVCSHEERNHSFQHSIVRPDIVSHQLIIKINYPGVSLCENRVVFPLGNSTLLPSPSPHSSTIHQTFSPNDILCVFSTLPVPGEYKIWMVRGLGLCLLASATCRLHNMHLSSCFIEKLVPGKTVNPYVWECHVHYVFLRRSLQIAIPERRAVSLLNICLHEKVFRNIYFDTFCAFQLTLTDFFGNNVKNTCCILH